MGGLDLVLSASDTRPVFSILLILELRTDNLWRSLPHTNFTADFGVGEDILIFPVVLELTVHRAHVLLILGSPSIVQSLAMVCDHYMSNMIR